MYKMNKNIVQKKKKTKEDHGAIKHKFYAPMLGIFFAYSYFPCIGYRIILATVISNFVVNFSSVSQQKRRFGVRAIWTVHGQGQRHSSVTGQKGQFSVRAKGTIQWQGKRHSSVAWQKGQFSGWAKGTVQ